MNVLELRLLKRASLDELMVIAAADNVISIDRIPSGWYDVSLVNRKSQQRASARTKELVEALRSALEVIHE
jgi:hypothetical protein